MQASRRASDHIDEEIAIATRDGRVQREALVSGEEAAPATSAGVDATAQGWHGQPFSADVTLPPLGVVWLVPE